MKVLDQLLLHGPLALERQALERLLHLGAGELKKPSDFYRFQPIKKNRLAGGATAVLAVHGILAPRGSWLLSLLGGTSLEELRAEFDSALADSSVERIVLDIDSPGGSVAGVAELGDRIFNARAKKQIVAYSGGHMASSAYWIGSAASRIVISPTASLGSIGVLAVVVDDRARQQRDGVVLHEIVSSGAPFKRPDPTTDSGRASIQAQVDALEAVFVEQVARQRGVSSSHVLSDFGRGGVLIGAAAVRARLADAIGTLDAASTGALAALGSSASAEGRRELWNRDPALRAEFGTFERYDAYMRHEERRLR